MTYSPLRIPSLVAAVACASAVSTAQDPPGTAIEIGHRYRVPSAALGEDREIRVRLPRSYGVSATHYPVIYVLDGNLHFEALAGTVKHLTWADKMPESIVVGISAVRRGAELTPLTARTKSPMLSFLTDELIPHIDTTYRSAPFRVLIGHSLGGLFTTHCLLTEPGAFRGYIASSPSLYWNDQQLVRELEAAIESERLLDATVFVSIGDRRERQDLRAAVERFAEVLGDADAIGLRHAYRLVDDTDHFDVLLAAFHRGLKTIFPAWGAFALARRGDLERLTAHYAGLSERFGYDVAVPEQMMNVTAYQLLQSEDLTAALAAFQRNVTAYPRSANCHDSLGEALDASGQTREAVAAFERACELAEAADDPRLPTYRARAAAARRKLR